MSQDIRGLPYFGLPVTSNYNRGNMELIERAGFLASLRANFESVKDGDGHCILLSGEAGIGKTSLIRVLSNEIKGECKIYQGTCDACSLRVSWHLCTI